VLQKPKDTYGVMVQLDKGGPNAAQAIEVLDPLCPACRAFEARLDKSGLEDRMDRKAILFPLDTCNWMITEATHPGACTVSEAVLCAGPRAKDVIEWSFANQERITSASKADPTAAARIVKERFPELASCVGSAEAKANVNKSLRWAVANNIRVLTPQLFVDNVKLCDEDVDLGLEYALSRMLDKHDAGTLAPPVLEQPPAPTGHDMAAEPTREAKPVEPKSEAKPAEPKGEAKPVEPATPTESTTPTETKPAEPAAPTETKPTEPKPADEQPAEPKPAEPSPPADQPVTSPNEAPAGGAP
jgi:hypothetical protein